MKQLPREIQSIMQEIRFVTEGGSCFECCDYEGMVIQLGEVLQKHIPQEQEAKPQIEKIEYVDDLFLPHTDALESKINELVDTVNSLLTKD